MTSAKPHSHEWISDNRYDWWNQDFLQLLLRRIRSDRMNRIADIGSGAAHWTAALLREFPRPVEVTCVDFEEHWVGKSLKTLSTLAEQHKVAALRGDAHRLPLEGSTFDLVTCQTVLMHCREPLKAVREMVRIAKPGGWVLVAEPTNLLNRVHFFDAIMHLPPKDQAKLYYAWACFHAGQKEETGADHDIAPLMPEMFKQAGLTDIVAYHNDRVILTVRGPENFESMEDEYRKSSFTLHAERGGATQEDMDEALASLRKLEGELKQSRALCAMPMHSYVFLGRKPQE